MKEDIQEQSRQLIWIQNIWIWQKRGSQAVREAVGSKVDIILENHCYTDAQSAVQFGNMAKKYGILYYEEPVVPHEDTLAYVHQQTGIPVASGERIYSRWQFKKMLDKQAIQVIQPDLGNSGGVTEVKKSVICPMYMKPVSRSMYVEHRS